MTLALFALSVTLGLQLFRVLFPLAFDLSESAGSINAGLFSGAVFAAGPLLAAPLRRVLGGRGALALGLVGAAAVRVAIQVMRPVPLWPAALGVGLILLAWTLLVHEFRVGRRDGATAIVVGLLLGMSLDTALRAASWSWDLAWRDGPGPMLVALALAAGALVLLPAALGEIERRRRATRSAVGPGPTAATSLLLLGPFLMLQVLFLQSVAFVASASRVSLPAATALVLLGDGLGIAAVGWVGGRKPSRPEVLGAGVLLVAAGALLRAIDGPLVGLAVVAGGALAATLLFVGLSSGRGSAAAWRTSAGFAGGIVVFLGLAFAYQVHYDIPLPFPNGLLPPAAALILAVPVLVPLRAPEPRSLSWSWAAIPIALLVVPLVLAIARDERLAPANGSLRLVDYNVHMAVNTEGQVDPEAIARVIEAEDPDVVVLQEVARGWVTNGMMDVAEWMSARLGMPYVYAPAADGQFGNAILSRLPILEQSSGRLGRFEGTMDRGYVWTVIDVGGGRSVSVIGTHLQHREQDTPTRLRQIGVLLDAWGGRDRTVIAGDMNDFPGSEEVARFVGTGFVSAQDDAGEGELPTSWQDGTRIDYVFATSDLALSGFARPFSRASDHLPLAVTVTPT